MVEGGEVEEIGLGRLEGERETRYLHWERIIKSRVGFYIWALDRSFCIIAGRL